MYSSIDELPTEVKNALDEDDCKVFLDAYNSKDPKTKEEIEVAKKYAWEQCRELPSSFSFDIIASVEDVDSDGELITLDSLKEQMDKFIEQGGTSQDEHGNYHVATIWDYKDYTDPDTGYPGIVVSGNVYGGRGENTEYAKARQDFIDGKNNLSIAGDASVEGYECDGQRCFVRRNLTQLMEISLVSAPANPYAKLLWYNDKAIVKSDSNATNLKVNGVEIHKSYNECDLEGIRKRLKGYDTRTSSEGVMIKGKITDAEELREIEGIIKGIGQIVTIDNGVVICDSNKRILEREFKKAHSLGEIDDKGMLTPKMQKKRFQYLYLKGMICKSRNGWMFNSNILKGTADEDWDERGNYIGPKNTIYVWDRHGNEILCFTSLDEHDTSTGWRINNVGSEKYWNYDAWGDHWDTIEEVIDAIRQHKRGVTIKRGVYWTDADYLEDVDIAKSRIIKSRYTFKLDFSNATIGEPRPSDYDPDDYNFPVSNFAIDCKGIRIAEGMDGVLAVSRNEIEDAEAFDAIYDRLYEELVDKPCKDFEEYLNGLPDDSDWDTLRRQEEEINAKASAINTELDNAIDNAVYTPIRVKKMPSISFKGTAQYGDAELDDEYVDELKAKIDITIDYYGGHYDATIETYSAGFIPSDEAVEEMMSFMESDSEEE